MFVDVNNTVYATIQTTKQVQIWSSQGGVSIRTLSNTLNNPGAIFVTSNGDIYVDSGNNHRVELWTPNATNGTTVMNVTNQCMGLFIDMNNTLYCVASESNVVVAKSLNAGPQSTMVVADWQYHRIQKFRLRQTNGQTVVGDEAPGTVGLYGPTGVVLDADGHLFITDTWIYRTVGS